jgi:hypothetical protein
MNHEAAGHEGHHHGGQPDKPVRDPVCGMNVDRSPPHTGFVRRALLHVSAARTVWRSST